MLTDILMLIIGILGLLGGIILALIAPEEFAHGKKYYLLLKRIMFVLIFFLVNYYLFIAGQYLAEGLFSFVMIILFVIELTARKWEWEGVNYFVFISPYFFSSSTEFHLLFGSFLFIYGLPTGTLLKHEFRTKK